MDNNTEKKKKEGKKIWYEKAMIQEMSVNPQKKEKKKHLYYKSQGLWMSNDHKVLGRTDHWLL